MWAVEAKNYDRIDNFAFYKSGLTEDQANALHQTLAKTGEWMYVRIYNLDYYNTTSHDSKIQEYFQQLEDGVGEGQTF